MTATSASCWKETIATSKNIDAGCAKQYLERWGVRHDFSKCRPPSSKSYQAFLDGVSHSAPVSEGISYAAWQNTDGEGAMTLFLLREEVACGLHPALTYNSSITIFIPKGDDPLDKEEITREADATRPLSLKNADNKSNAAVTNVTLRAVISTNMVDVQRGFMSGRELGQNIVDLDSAGRAFGMEGEVSFIDPLGAHLLPLLAFFDFAAAFPSLIQEWMYLVRRFIGMPIGLFNIGCVLLLRGHAHHDWPDDSVPVLCYSRCAARLSTLWLNICALGRALPPPLAVRGASPGGWRCQGLR